MCYWLCNGTVMLEFFWGKSNLQALAPVREPEI